MNFLSKNNIQRHGCVPFSKCRAKTCEDGKTPGTFVLDHCRYAGYVADALAHILPVSILQKLPSDLPFCVALHDIGKVSPGFTGKYFSSLLEKYAPEWISIFKNKGTSTNHASIGARALADLLKINFGIGIESNAVIEAIASHHGYCSPGKGRDSDEWQTEREKLVKKLADEFSADLSALKTVEKDASLLSGLTCISDWIASDETFFPADEAPLSITEAKKRAQDAVAQCGFSATKIRQNLTFTDIFGYTPWPVQQSFFDSVHDVGTYVLEAPMGLGKTEAALYAAYRLLEKGKNSGIYFALPTRLTSDRIYLRMERFIHAISANPSSVKLAHGRAWLKGFEIGKENFPDSENPLIPRVPPWFNPSKRGLLYPFAVGTIDQALMGVINVKHSFIRQFGLAGKVVILDEVHSYDSYTGTLLDHLVERLNEIGCTVIILSATLTQSRRDMLLHHSFSGKNAYPLVTGIQTNGNCPIHVEPEAPVSHSVRLSWLDASERSPMDQALEKAREGANVLCIANTVATSQTWYREIQSARTESDDFPIGLLHSRFTDSHRSGIEQKWMSYLGKDCQNRPHGSVLIATQIVEQSVDIDADFLISELAPIDMVFQRVGRLWRHERDTRPVKIPELMIVCKRLPDLPLETDPDNMPQFFGQGCFVYSPYVLLRTFEVLREKRELVIPSEIRSSLERVYMEETSPTPLHQALYEKLQKEKSKLQGLALAAQSNCLPVLLNGDEHPPTRYNSRIFVPLLLLRSIDCVTNNVIKITFLNGDTLAIPRFNRDFSCLKPLYDNIVRVGASKEIKPFSTDNELLSRYFISSEMPYITLCSEIDGTLTFYDTGKPVGYGYREDIGAYRIENVNGGENVSSFADEEDDFIFDEKQDW